MLKVETAHYPNGSIATISTNYPGSTPDFTIFKDRIEVYKKILKKNEDKQEMEDEDPLSETYPRKRLLIADSAYTGASKYLRARTVDKKTIQRISSQKKKTSLYQKIGWSVRIFMEKCWIYLD